MVTRKLSTVWTKRTVLEQILLVVSAALVGIVVLLLIALSRDSAPMATEWGPVAAWVGAAVTFLGFVGAIAALKVQTKAVDAQLEQHDKIREAGEAQERKDSRARMEAALDKKEKDARAVTLTVAAGRGDAGAGHEFVDKQPFEVTCTLVFPLGDIKYTNVEFRHPEKPDGFRITFDESADRDFRTVERGRRILWGISGEKWPHGPEDEAKDWVASRSFVTFTDRSDNRWKLDGMGELTEVTV